MPTVKPGVTGHFECGGDFTEGAHRIQEEEEINCLIISGDQRCSFGASPWVAFCGSYLDALFIIKRVFALSFSSSRLPN